MNRRTVIKNLALVIGGAALLPSCLHDSGKASIALKKINVSADQEKFLADVAETIIPKTDTSGAKDLNLHLFVLKMVDDCFSKKDQTAFMSGLDKLSKEAENRFGKPFGQCSQSQRESLLNELDHKQAEFYKAQQANKNAKKEVPADDMLAFYAITKGETVFGYTNSKYFMTKQIVWELVPGRYNAYFPVKNLKPNIKHG
ncbi:gluconate 2-dehydrogenase subunit 3 family protein [Mucilaginibacter jinjuensis]|uniref:Gluconate 2-dehydrogenase subunit 3 family protein n=1 Tax=Mucilaginibacter jinjuensis TaxID=1176721 RepID=A0ABY7T3H8_9SPHI|nr:gluconate 2-dehydrogenase subunit 3 family protein [Mucilaginibacter jinjuensis]WCT10886.1 gluconate 2-dehydrogenase subunit 3 family protein [Mucilaginibacter jinjuensis]